MRYPARPGSVRVTAAHCQRLTRLGKRRLKFRAARLNPFAFKLLDFMLYGWRWVGDLCDPALSTLAKGTGMARSTVQKGIKTLERAGLLRVIRRGEVIGGRWSQISNVYVFDAGPSDTATRQPPNLSTREKVKESAEPDRLAAQEALRRVREARFARIRSGFASVSGAPRVAGLARRAAVS